MTCGIEWIEKEDKVEIGRPVSDKALLKVFQVREKWTDLR